MFENYVKKRNMYYIFDTHKNYTCIQNIFVCFIPSNLCKKFFKTFMYRCTFLFYVYTLRIYVSCFTSLCSFDTIIIF
jgi:hypothetical protein